MKQINKKPEILRFYMYSIQEVMRVELKCMFYKHMIYCNIYESTDLLDTIDEEINHYMQNICYEMRALLFMLRNENKLVESDIDLTLDTMDENFEERFEYLEELSNSLDMALTMRSEKNFMLPNKSLPFMDEKDYNAMLSKIKGYNEDELECFLVEEKIIEPYEYDEIRKRCKILKGNLKKYMSLFGTYDNAIVVPEIKDELSMCINIHEIVNYVLLRMNGIDNEIIESEDLATFYELLYQKINLFSKEKLRSTKRALKLLNDYNDEPFEEQIRKVSRIK